MKHFISIAIALFISNAALADQPLGIVLQSDGPWIDLPEGTVITDAAPQYEDILAMADLDGDPSITTPQEARMIALLSDVLMGQPIIP
jgi:hypothetical protein